MQPPRNLRLRTLRLSIRRLRPCTPPLMVRLMTSPVRLTYDQPRPEQAGPRQEPTMTIREAQATVQQPRTGTQVDPIDQMMAWAFLADVEAGTRRARPAELRRRRSQRAR